MIATAATAYAGSASANPNAPGQQQKIDASVATTATTAGTTTTLTTRQPLSNADLNAGGANNGGNCGAYCSTRDRSAALNGSGTGQAVGKPCAGCVGKADNKNPHGQSPNGSDLNKGYECDANNGIGKTNPAHTGCQRATVTSCTVSATCPATPSGCAATNSCPATPSGCAATNSCPATPSGCAATNSCPATLSGCAASNSCAATPSGCAAVNSCPTSPSGCVPAQANNFCSTVLGRKVTPTPPSRQPTVLPNRLVRTPTVLPKRLIRTPKVLPFTGVPAVQLLDLALLLVVVGGSLAQAGRRRPVRCRALL